MGVRDGRLGDLQKVLFCFHIYFIQYIYIFKNYMKGHSISNLGDM